jgi:hypothetical protein
MVLATAFAFGLAASIAVSVALAFLFGYTLTTRPVLRAGVGFRRAVGVAFASDTVALCTATVSVVIPPTPRRSRSHAVAWCAACSCCEP